MSRSRSYLCVTFGAVLPLMFSLFAPRPATAAPVPTPAAPKAPVSFINDVAPILKENCYGCHGSKNPKGKLDIVKTAGYWLKGAADRGIRHICWDGCMFPNSTLEDPKTWNTILATMLKVRETSGWNA